MNAVVQRLVWHRAASRWVYRQLHQDDDHFRLHIEHIIAKQQGGSDLPTNLCL